MKANSLDISAAASMSYAMFTGDVSTDYSKHKQEIDEYQSSRSSHKEIYIGGAPPKSGDWHDW